MLDLDVLIQGSLSPVGTVAVFDGARKLPLDVLGRPPFPTSLLSYLDQRPLINCDRSTLMMLYLSTISFLSARARETSAFSLEFS